MDKKARTTVAVVLVSLVMCMLVALGIGPRVNAAGFLYPVTQPVKLFTDVTGVPLNNGFIYFGQPNQNPEVSTIQMYWDVAGTIPAAQPIRTTNGYISRQGAPANIYATGDFSITVRNSNMALVLTSPVSVDLQLALAITGIGTAAAIPIADAGNYYVTKNVEAALQQVAGPGFVTFANLATAVQNLLVPSGAVMDYGGSATGAVGTAPAGWIFGAGRTIGNVASNSTERANADTATLYTLLWNNYDNTRLPIQDSTGTPTTRGASAANDFAANKRLPVPDYRGRVRASLDFDNGGGAASRITVAGGNFDGTIMGNSGGAQNHTMLQAESAIPSHSHTITDPGHAHTMAHTHTITDPQHAHTYTAPTANVSVRNDANQVNVAGPIAAGTATSTNATGITGTNGSSAANTGSNTTGITTTNSFGAAAGSSHTILQPTITNVVIIKL